jgi:hypothetical protein
MVLFFSGRLCMRQLTPQYFEIPSKLFLGLIGAGYILIHIVFKLPVFLLVVRINRKVFVVDLFLQTLDEV